MIDPRGQVGVAGGEEAFAQIVRFEQPPEFHPQGGIRHPCGGQIKAGKSLEGLAVGARVFAGFISQAIPWLEKIDPQPALQSEGQASALAFGIERSEVGQKIFSTGRSCAAS